MEIEEKIPNMSDVDVQLREYCDESGGININTLTQLPLQYNATTIAIYDDAKKNIKHCYDVNEIVSLMRPNIIGKNSQLHKYVDGVMCIRLYNWDIYVIEEDMKRCLNKGANTLFVRKVPKKNHYSVHTSSRSKILGDDYDIYIKNNFTQPDISDEISEHKIAYKKYIYYFFDVFEYDFKNDTLPLRKDKIFKVIWVRNNKHGKPIIDSCDDKPALQINGEHSVDLVWYKNGKINRKNDKPAYVSYSYNGDIILKEWLMDGEKYERKNGQANHIEFFNTKLTNGRKNVKSMEVWFKGEKEHRENDLPSSIEYHANGSIKAKRWRRNDEYYIRPDNQANVIRYYTNQTKEREEWLRKNNDFYRSGDKPSKISYDEKGRLSIEEWLLGGEEDYFREDESKAVKIMYAYRDEFVVDGREAKVRESKQQPDIVPQTDNEDNENNNNDFKYVTKNAISANANANASVNANVGNQIGNVANIAYQSNFGGDDVDRKLIELNYNLGDEYSHLNPAQANYIRNYVPELKELEAEEIEGDIIDMCVKYVRIYNNGDVGGENESLQQVENWLVNSIGGDSDGQFDSYYVYQVLIGVLNPQLRGNQGNVGNNQGNVGNQGNAVAQNNAPHLADIEEDPEAKLIELNFNIDDYKNLNQGQRNAIRHVVEQLHNATDNEIDHLVERCLTYFRANHNNEDTENVEDDLSFILHLPEREDGSFDDSYSREVMGIVLSPQVFVNANNANAHAVANANVVANAIAQNPDLHPDLIDALYGDLDDEPVIGIENLFGNPNANANANANAGNANNIIDVVNIGASNVGPIHNPVNYINNNDIDWSDINNLSAGQLNAIRTELKNNFDEAKITEIARRSAGVLVSADDAYNIEEYEQNWTEATGIAEYDPDIARRILYIAFNPQLYVNYQGNINNEEDGESDDEEEIEEEEKEPISYIIEHDLNPDDYKHLTQGQLERIYEILETENVDDEQIGRIIDLGFQYIRNRYHPGINRNPVLQAQQEQQLSELFNMDVFDEEMLLQIMSAVFNP